MPWLADLVESNDSSLDVLPVQCLCEFLLHDVPSDVTASSTGDDASQAERHKKQVGSAGDGLLLFFIHSAKIEQTLTQVT